jgi:hypothetical protein
MPLSHGDLAKWKWPITDSALEAVSYHLGSPSAALLCPPHFSLGLYEKPQDNPNNYLPLEPGPISTYESVFFQKEDPIAEKERDASQTELHWPKHLRREHSHTSCLLASKTYRDTWWDRVGSP